VNKNVNKYLAVLKNFDKALFTSHLFLVVWISAAESVV